MINTLKKLSLATINSAEIEVVLSGKRFPKCTWFRHLRLAQGTDDKENILS